MLTINIRGLGLDVNNIPVEIFDHSLGITDVPDGVNIQVDESAEEAVKEILNKALDGRFIMNRIGSGILTFEPVPGPAQAEEAPQPIDTPEPSVVQGEASAEETVDDEVDEGDLDPDDELDDDEDANMRASGFNIDAYQPVEGDAINTMIGSLTGTETANRAALVRQTNEDFNRKWEAAINVKRRLDELTAEIAGDPLVATLTGQVALLNEADNLYENVFFSDDSVVVITKELLTSAPVAGNVRKIGRMAFIIKASGFVGNPTSRGLVAIKNLDRRCESRGDYWECGHVPSGGEPCYGTAWEMLFQAFVSRDLPSVAEVLIRFVTQPNMADSWGTVMSNWPIHEVEV